MIYIVKRGDTLDGIAARHGISLQMILENNIICNPNTIFIDQPIYIPDRGIDYGKVGGGPYYVVQYGDTLACIAAQFNKTVTSLAATNQLSNTNQIFAGDELIIRDRPNPEELLNGGWNPDDCEYTGTMVAFDYFNAGSFLWEALGETAVPYLVQLLKHQCDDVRYFAVLSLGRIAKGARTRLALKEALKDRDPAVVKLADLALRRFELVKTYTKRLHIVTSDLELMPKPKFESPSVPVPRGTEVISLRWKIPSTTDEEGPRGGPMYYDKVQILSSGKVGFLPRLGFELI
ncbi:MAG: LysM peptidoglycan-binding domain-containing protein [Bacillota bacterium]